MGHAILKLGHVTLIIIDDAILKLDNITSKLYITSNTTNFTIQFDHVTIIIYIVIHITDHVT